MLTLAENENESAIPSYVSRSDRRSSVMPDKIFHDGRTSDNGNNASRRPSSSAQGISYATRRRRQAYPDLRSAILTADIILKVGFEVLGEVIKMASPKEFFIAGLLGAVIWSLVIAGGLSLLGF